MTKEEIIDAIAAMSVMDVCELVKAMEEKFGVSAAAAVVAGPAAGGAAAVRRVPGDSPRPSSPRHPALRG